MGLNLSTLSGATSALVLVIGLIWLGSRGVQFFGLAARVRGGGESLQIEETLALDARRRLYLIRCVDRRLVLLTGGERDQVVGWISQADGSGGRSA